MNRYHVAPSWYSYDDLSLSPRIEAESAGDAASEYVRLNHANLDYPQTTTIQTLEYNDDNRAVICVFIVDQVPMFESRFDENLSKAARSRDP